MCCPIPRARTCGKAFILDRNTFSHVAAVLPRKTDFALEMLCMHHIIPNRHAHPSGGFYSWLFAPDHGGSRTTKLCLGAYPACYGSVAMEDNKKSCPPGGVMVEWSHDGATMIATFIVVITLILIIIAQWGYSRANCKHIRANCNHFE